MSPDFVDAALETTRATQQRLRVLPSRVGIYLLRAAALFAEVGYQQVWARLVAGLEPATVAAPGSSALSQALRSVGSPHRGSCSRCCAARSPVGHVGRACWCAPSTPPRRSSPRVVKRAISKHRAKGAIYRTDDTTAITIEILDG